MQNKNRFWLIAIVLLACVLALCFLVPKVWGAQGLTGTTAESKKVPDNRTEQTASSNSKKEKKSAKAKGNVPYLPATHRGELVIHHKAYSLSFNTEHNNPNWVQWMLTAERANGSGRRSNEFLPDPDEKLEWRHQVNTDDYKGSGYDRGHMCPAADNRWDAKAMTECFYMSNMCPQLHELNSGSWETLESACRRWAQREGCIYIVSGPVYDWELKARREEPASRKRQTIGRQHKVTVPTGFFKCVLSLREGEEKAIGFYYTNDDKRQEMRQVCMPVDSIEAMTGFDFFHNLDKKVEKRVEAKCNLKDWK